jgi:uncharacterized protein
VPIAYLDTSALAKLYVQESGRERVEALIQQTGTVVTSVIAYPEARAVFARRRASGELLEHEHAEMVAQFQTDWSDVNGIDVTPAVYRRAGELVMAHPRLRAMDAIHLASALEARTVAEIRFLTFDHDLEAAARAVLHGPEVG